MWQAFGGLGPEERAKVVTHELTHAALAGSTSGRTPAWLGEGVALYVVRRPARPRRRARTSRALSRPDAIARLAGTAQGDAYATSSAAAFAIADRFGRRALLRLYDAFNDPSLRGRARPEARRTARVAARARASRSATSYA